MQLRQLTFFLNYNSFCSDFIGLNYIDWKSHFTPAVEVGRRLGSQYWNKGYTTEGAKASLEYGFQKCDLKEIVCLLCQLIFALFWLWKRLN